MNKNELLSALNIHAAVADKKQDWATAKRDTDEIIGLKPEDPKILEAAKAINAMAASHLGRTNPSLKKDMLDQPWNGAGGGEQALGAAKGAPAAGGWGAAADASATIRNPRQIAEIRKLLQDSQTKLGLGDPQGALVAALDVADRDEKNPQARLLAAIALLALDKLDMALKAANQAIEYRQAQGPAADAQQKAWLGAAYTTRGRAEEALAQLDKARADYQRAVELDPQGQAQAATVFLQRLDQTLGAAAAGRSAGVPGAADAAKRKRTGWLLIVLGALTFGGAVAAMLKLKRGGRGATTGSRGLATPLDDTPATAGGLCKGLNLGHYELRRPLGRGGMGEVWEAFDHSLNRLVAIKKVAGSSPGDQAALDGLIEEALNVAKLKHPNIVAIHFVFRGQQTGDIYVVFEHVGEGTVMDALQASPIAPAQVAAIVRGVCSALDFAHSQGVIHRDLKPSNILLERGEAKVGDFGIAKLTDHSDGTLTIRNVGTPAYMAPEQALGAVSRQTDLYALGVSTYQMLTGQLPFPQARPELKARGEFKAATKLVPTLPPAVDAFFGKALHPDPKLRFKSGAEFATEFVQAVGTETPLPRAAS